jgi:hypothetical protein
MTCKLGRTYRSNDATIGHRERLLLSPVREKVHAYLATVVKNEDFRDEYRTLLESHGIEFDERYVWD